MNQNIKFMKTKLFALLRTFMFAVLPSVMSISLVACEPESNEGTDADDVTSQVAVTGLVDAYGCKYADISGYANLNLLPTASGTPVIGVELVKADDIYHDDVVRATTTTLVGNIFTVSFKYLSPDTEYKYRSYVAYGGQVYYGKKYGTLTTKKVPEGAVDLGLSVLWASCNVGADSPEELGGLYAWGEIEEKDDYSWENYKWCNDSYLTLTKYCTDDRYGTVDNKTVLDPEDDVAHVKWGGDWCMPTREELYELCSKCGQEKTSVNGTEGFKFTGPNGNDIFIPVIKKGQYYDYCDLWSASRVSGVPYNAYLIDYDSSRVMNERFSTGERGRCRGCSVRPVVK